MTIVETLPSINAPILFYNKANIINGHSIYARTYTAFLIVNKNNKINFILENSEYIVATYEKMAVVRFDLRRLPNTEWIDKNIITVEHAEFEKLLTPEDHYHTQYDTLQIDGSNLCIMKIKTLEKLNNFPMLKRTAKIK